MKENEVYGPVMSNQQFYEYVYAQPPEKIYETIN